MTCDCCDKAREWPGYRMYSPACLYCGARLIQAIGRLSIPVTQVQQRRRAVLSDWIAHGHAEAQLRALAACQALAIGPVQSLESDRPAPKKSR